MRRRHSASSPNIVSPFLALVLALVVAATSPAARADDEQVKVRAEVGAEYDNNVHWAAQTGAAGGPPRLGSSLVRVVVGVAAADQLGTNQDVSVSLLGAGKTFWVPEARSENIAVLESSAAWRIVVGPRTRLGVSGHYYDAIQAGTAAERDLSGVARDFRSLSPTFRVIHAFGQSSGIALGLGYRWFVYKPLPAYDFQAPVAGIEYRVSAENADGSADWELLTSAGAELRRFAGTRLVSERGCAAAMCTAVVDAEGTRQNDQFFLGRIDLTRTGRLLLGLGYGVQWNRSNSFSETLLRHVGTLRLTVPLPFALYLAARSELVFVTYADRAAFRASSAGRSFSTIDDENRSQLRAELSRDVGAHLQLIARYSLYLNAIGQGTYQRQVASLSLALTYD